MPAETVYPGAEDQTTGIAGLTTKKSGWILKKELFKYLIQMKDYDKSKYTVFDERKMHAFTVSGGQPNSVSDGMLFLDSHGGRLAYMGRKASESQYTQVLLTFKPNFLGQESLENSPIGLADGNESVPLYRYAYIESPGFNGYRFKRYVSNDQTVDAWYVQEKSVAAVNVDVKSAVEVKFDVKSVDTDEVIAQVGQDPFFTFDADTE